MKRILLVTGALLLVAGACLGVSWAKHDPAVWVEEFHALQAHLAVHYANLDWMVSHRKMDLTALAASTERDLSDSHIPWQASRALKRFVDAFHDPHLRMEPWKPEPPQAAATPAPGSTAASAAPAAPEPTCDGFRDRNKSFRFPFDEASGWKPAGGAWFPAGSFGDVGVMRIAHFGEDGYLEACREAGRAHVRERLNQEVRRTLGELKARGIRTLVVDITGNGGGTEWVAHVTAMLTPRTLTRPRTKMIEPQCDRAPIWRGEPVCPNLMPDGESTMDGEGVWDGPLALLVDGGTASASEDMVVWLRESHVVTIIGQRTYGAGCGYSRGGAPARLERIGWTVLMPNCARYTSDGINEVEGIDPDVKLDLENGSAADRIARLTQALPR